VRKAATTVAAIPGFGPAESLNAGVAGSIAMFSLSQALATP
jgi:tRNA G18 (ribose-2'-O)-methylase SpoU